MAENPIFLGLFRQTFRHPDSSGPSAVWEDASDLKLKSIFLPWLSVATVFSFLLAGILDKIDVSELLVYKAYKISQSDASLQNTFGRIAGCACLQH